MATVVTALSLAPFQATGQYTLFGTSVLAVLLLAEPIWPCTQASAAHFVRSGR